jgi:hypothetical protein
MPGLSGGRQWGLYLGYQMEGPYLGHLVESLSLGYQVDRYEAYPWAIR